MSFENDFLDCMPQSVVVNTISTIDAYGKPSFATSATTYAALIQQEQVLVRALDGTEKMAETTAIINATGTINPEDQITLSEGDTRPILSIQTLSDNEGIHHTVIHFGRKVS